MILLQDEVFRIKFLIKAVQKSTLKFMVLAECHIHQNAMSWNSQKGLFLLLVAAALAVFVMKAKASEAESLQVVSSLDLKRYTGRWYEIARYPNRFQRKCWSNTTAEYTLRNDGKIQVVNTCRQSDDKLNTAKGTARVVDNSTNAKLKVTFFWPFSGDYWVIGLGKNYEYAIVGEPSRKYLWILSRTPQMAPELYAEALNTLGNKGYDSSRLIATRQGKVD